MEVNIALLYFANQLGKKMSKFSLSESEYFLAINVNGQNILNTINTTPSKITSPIPTQVYGVILLKIPV